MTTMSLTGRRRWARAERHLLVRAAEHAPVLCPERPWVVELHEGEVRLYELATRTARDSAGLDRLLTCGTALACLHLALRELGWRVAVDQSPAAGHPDLVAVLRPTGRAGPSPAEHTRFAALEGITSAGALPADLTGAGPWPGVELRPLRGPSEAAELARLLLAFGDRLESTVDLRVWLPPHGPASDFDQLCEATARIAGDPLVLVLLTPDDTCRDHVRAGAALAWAMLGAQARGWAAHPITAPFHLPEFRACLVDGLDLAGHPHALLRITEHP
jgi:hypothetical protein